MVVVPDHECIKWGLHLMRDASEAHLLSLDKVLADALFNYLWLWVSEWFHFGRSM